ncbi:MAG: Ig-like domain-containing protein [Clostridiales Family XIII bacterium]|jgi:hypothetical protein|nr:Ig-like domain-containing protein [Clostridiales Family XIII bacterium]
MRKKILALTAAVLFLASAAFIAVSAADTDAGFSIALDRATKQVTITGAGYAPNADVSLMAAYDAVPAFGNLDYVGQLKADAEGSIAFTYPSSYAGDWLGGQSYYVMVNGQLQSEMLQATTVKAHSSVRYNMKLKGDDQPLDFEIDGVLYEFTSSNPGVARVSSEGLVTAVRSGTAVITLKATDGSGKSSSITVFVTP